MEPSGKPPAKTIASSIIALVLVAIFIGFPLYSYFAVPAFPGAGEGLDDGSLGEFPTVTHTPVSTTTVPTSPPVTFTSTPTRTVVVSTPQGTSSPPNARFSASTYSGTAPLTIYFRDDSTGLPTTWSWDFGDGSSATIQNPVHTYSNPGTYSVRLSVTGPGGSSTSYPEVIQVSGTTPSSVIAAFSATPGGGLIPLTVNFIDMSSGSPVSWSWDFGDGETSTLQNPVHTYTSPGYYTARLTVRSSSGATSTATAPAPIIAGAPITTVTTTVVTQVPTTVSATGSAPVASFTYTPDLGPVPLMVTFHDTSIGTPATWYWDFGDGSTSTLKNPVHTYQDVGDFYVLLTVTNSAGTSMTEQGPISVFYRL